MKPRVHPDDIDRFLAAVDRIHGDGMAGRFTMRIVHDDGSMHEIMGMGTTEYDENGVAVALVGMNIDTSYEMTGLGARLPEEPVVDPLADAARAPG